MKRSEWANTWLQQGKHELGAARVLRNNKFWAPCALMCQQAGEKAVKALWIDVRQQDPPRVHWLEKLAEDLDAPEEIINCAAVLVADYTASRYPAGGTSGPYGEFTDEDADDRIAKAESVIAWVESQWED